MEAKDLRLNNYVSVNNLRYYPKIKGKTLKVRGIRKELHKYVINLENDNNNDYEYEINQEIDSVIPIILNHKWLTNFGFKEINLCQGGFIFSKKVGINEFYLHPENYNCGILQALNDDINFKELEFVHELQNLFYQTMGEELVLS